MSECRAATVADETYCVTVPFLTPLRTLIAKTWNDRTSFCKWMFFGMLFTSLYIIVMCWVFVWSDCHQKPGMELESLSIRDMAVYQNTTSMAWQVDSAINVTLLTSNPNWLVGCFTTYRQVMVRVEYKSETILQQEVPLGFGLKPQRNRSVTMELQAQEVQLKNPYRGTVLEAELRGGKVTLDIFFDGRYLRNDRKAEWCILDACWWPPRPPILPRVLCSTSFVIPLDGYILEYLERVSIGELELEAHPGCPGQQAERNLKSSCEIHFGK